MNTYLTPPTVASYHTDKQESKQCLKGHCIGIVYLTEAI